MTNTNISSHDRAAVQFVDTTAKLSLLMAVFGIIWCLCQWLVVVLLGQLDIVGWMRGEGLPIPAVFFWLDRHANALSVLMLLLSIGFFAVSWGLFKRREWGRVGYVVCLLLVALANFAVVPLVDAVVVGLQQVIPADFLSSPEGRELRVQLLVARWTMLLTTGAAALGVAVLHAWLAMKFHRADIRALFD